jgi:hypothetical protein
VIANVVETEKPSFFRIGRVDEQATVTYMKTRVELPPGEFRLIVRRCPAGQEVTGVAWPGGTDELETELGFSYSEDRRSVVRTGANHGDEPYRSRVGLACVPPSKL